MHLISTGDSQQSPATTHQFNLSSCAESLRVKLYAFLATRQTVFKPEGSVARCGLVLHPKVKVQELLFSCAGVCTANAQLETARMRELKLVQDFIRRQPQRS